ncbi:MAG: alpha/beta hydrolase [Acidobacteriota bacterium]|nr:alpha/beta hydrolase [Acidobacteriota bacterium]
MLPAPKIPRPHALPPLLAALLLPALLLLGACSPEKPAEEEAAALEPVEIHDTVTVGGTATAPDGVEIAYSSRGTSSPALVFLHCWSCDRSFWRHQVEPFSRDHQVVTIDLGGHGESGRDRQNWSLESLGQDAVAVIESLGLERLIVVGHSMGAPVALEVAQSLPDRVQGVVVVDSLQNVEQEHDAEQWKALLAGYRQDFPGTCGQMVGAMFHEGTDGALVNEITQSMCDAPPAIAIALLDAFPAYDMADELSQVQVPVRALNGDLFPTAVETNRRHAADYDASILTGSGHFPLLEKPEEFNRELEVAVAGILANEKAADRPATTGGEAG